MHRLALVVLVHLVLAACGGSSKSSESTMPTGGTTATAPGGAAAGSGPSCGEAADRTVDTLSKAHADAPPDMVKKIRDTLASHCEKDGWSAESRSCFAHMQTPDDGNKCEEGLSQAQKDSLNKEAVPEEGGSRGPKKGGDPEDGGE
ncbi:MAG: hypothetical protein ABJE66_09260 [Deltaproteobacteria bacterium]